MALALCDIVRGAVVRLCADENGQTAKNRVLGMISRVEYQNKPADRWSASGLAKRDGKPALWVDFGKGETQVAPAQLVLHRSADRRALDALKDRDADAMAELMGVIEKPIDTDPLRLAKEKPKTK